MKRLLWLGLPLAIVLAFQACDSRIRTDGTNSGASTQNNGDFYTGKPGIYTQVDPQKKCTQLSLNGNPFPNRIVQYDAVLRRALLVRDNCADQEPVEIPQSSYSISADGNSLTYQGQDFAFQADASEFNLAGLICPPGRVVMNSSPVNLFQSSLHLVAPAWDLNPGIESFLFGTIEALPRYAIRRLASGPFENWRRISQRPSLDANVEYATSFLVEPGNTDYATFVFHVPPSELVVDLNFTTGTAGITFSQGWPVTPSVVVNRYDTAYHVNVFFTPVSATGAQSEIGVTSGRNPNGPAPGQAGDYIYATAGTLHRVNDYCQ